MRRGRISEYAEKFRCEFHEARTPWSVPCQVAFPSATQNEVDEEAATTLIKNGVIAVGEGANMPCTLEATRAFLNANVLLGPSKAANAGGVAVSGLEQSQNALHLSWSREEVCKRLQQIMSDIHAKCCQFGEDPRGHINYVKSRAPTSLASSRWPTRCSRTARSDGMPRARCSGSTRPAHTQDRRGPMTLRRIVTGGAVLALLMLPGGAGFSFAAGSRFEANLEAVAPCDQDAKPANLDFTLKDMNGADVGLAAFRGKVILLNFWATWCGPCRIEVPGFVELQEEYRDQGLVVLGLSVTTRSAGSRPLPPSSR